MSIPFNKPFLTGLELAYIEQAVQSGKISGDGMFTKKCHEFFQETYGFQKCLLTTSCTDALEMAALLIEIEPGDEVIMPSYTFVSTANAFVLRGATIIFCDSRKDHPGMDEDMLESLISPRTRAIVPVHYAGVACNMDKIMALADKHGIYVIEDAAQAIDSYYTNSKGEKKALGGIGHLAAFSFHETKNIISGEGGMLVINDPRFNERAEIIREKGTNRAKFFRGEVDKYGWMDLGSSFLPSDIIAAFLYAQLECMQLIQEKRKQLWNAYWKGLEKLAVSGHIRRPSVPDYASNNAHIFYIICWDLEIRGQLISHLREHNIMSVFHYQSLHASPYQQAKSGTEKQLPQCDHYSNSLLRLPLYYELELTQVEQITSIISDFFKQP